MKNELFEKIQKDIESLDNQRRELICEMHKCANSLDEKLEVLRTEGAHHPYLLNGYRRTLVEKIVDCELDNGRKYATIDFDQVIDEIEYCWEDWVERELYEQDDYSYEIEKVKKVFCDNKCYSFTLDW